MHVHGLYAKCTKRYMDDDSDPAKFAVRCITVPRGSPLRGMCYENGTSLDDSLITDAQGAASPVAVDDDRDEASISARAQMATMCRVIIRRSFFQTERLRVQALLFVLAFPFVG